MKRNKRRPRNFKRKRKTQQYKHSPKKTPNLPDGRRDGRFAWNAEPAGEGRSHRDHGDGGDGDDWRCNENSGHQAIQAPRNQRVARLGPDETFWRKAPMRSSCNYGPPLLNRIPTWSVIFWEKRNGSGFIYRIRKTRRITREDQR